MKDFSRISWSSADAEAKWKPLIQKAAASWLEVEVLSVVHGQRKCGLIFGKSRLTHPKLKYKEVAPDRFAIATNQKDCDNLANAFLVRNDDVVGELLGFPICCRDFFARTWGSGELDTTHQMAESGTNGPIECNILGRWLGIRWVTHLPCSFNCKFSQQIGKAMREIMFTIDPDSATVIDEVLSWPVEWSALHSIAEIKYPVAKVSTLSSYSATKLVVQRKGTKYPEFGSRGTVFPYRKTVADTPLVLHAPSYKDNGFTTQTAMDQAHTMILQELNINPPEGIVVDLGCGNGELIARVGAIFDVPTKGIECDVKKSRGNSNIIISDLRNIRSLSINDVDTLLVSVRRFEEIPWLKTWCKENARQTIAYSYDQPTFARAL